MYLATENAQDGIQLDMFFDPSATGRLGLRTDTLLANSIQGARWPVVAAEYQALYLLRKRHWKGDRKRVERIRQELLGFDQTTLEHAIRTSVGKGVATSIDHIRRDSWHDFKTPFRNLLADPFRRFGRLRNPVGFWIDIIGSDGEGTARKLAGRFERILVTQTGTRPAQRVAMARWLARDVAPLRWKPGLYVSSSLETAGTIRANLELTDATGPGRGTSRFGRCGNGGSPETRQSVEPAEVSQSALGIPTIIGHKGQNACRKGAIGIRRSGSDPFLQQVSPEAHGLLKVELLVSSRTIAQYPCRRSVIDLVGSRWCPGGIFPIYKEEISQPFVAANSRA